MLELHRYHPATTYDMEVAMHQVTTLACLLVGGALTGCSITQTVTPFPPQLFTRPKSA